LSIQLNKASYNIIIGAGGDNDINSQGGNSSFDDGAHLVHGGGAGGISRYPSVSYGRAPTIGGSGGGGAYNGSPITASLGGSGCVVVRFKYN
jgi:hypothetical protein